ncbi:RWD domain-containing protein 3-like isoform X1 [Daphnia pulicaria]|uniref:RWD domain-containing protein 3-like isoform X1 n=1 Tax=Daphnia pulicaria TaxID=35523 RepID=UPI001EEA87E9|nr:RWD domain-containing protein 3-like isoform X1 [Daphnia pulicaria]
MNNQDIADEIEALSAILCAASEFEVKSSDENEVILVIQPQQINSNVISLTVVLDPKSYPSSSPQLSVQSPRLSRAELQNLDTLIKQQASKLQGEVTILSLVEWLVEYCLRYEEEMICRATNPVIERDIDNDYTVVAQLDHIRSKTIYLKTLNQWFRELDLHGVLISYRKWIFLLVSGKKDSLQLYLKRHRTQNVDVDSGGRPCRERMLTVLGQVEEPLDAGGVLVEVELNDSGDDWSTYWKSRSLLVSIYQKFIQPQTGQKK